MIKDISVVIPYFNELESLPMTLAQLAGQSVLPKEAIFIDSGSTDGSYDLIERWITNNPCEVKVINIRGCLGTPSSSRNLGIETATGRYVALMDCGLLFEKDWLEKQCSYLETNAVDVVSGLCWFTGVTRLDKVAIAHNYGYGRLHPTVPSTLAKRSVFEVTGLFRSGLRAGDDIEWVRALARRKIKRGVNQEVIIRYDGLNYSGSLWHLWVKSFRYASVFPLMFMRRRYLPYYVILMLIVLSAGFVSSARQMWITGSCVFVLLGYVMPIYKSRGVRLLVEDPPNVLLLPFIGLMIYVAKLCGAMYGLIKYGVLCSHLRARTVPK